MTDVTTDEFATLEILNGAYLADRSPFMTAQQMSTFTRTPGLEGIKAALKTLTKKGLVNRRGKFYEMTAEGFAAYDWVTKNVY